MLEGKLEELKFELDQEMAISQATQESLEEQIRTNRQLEVEINELKQAAYRVSGSAVCAFSDCLVGRRVPLTTADHQSILVLTSPIGYFLLSWNSKILYSLPNRKQLESLPRRASLRWSTTHHR